MKQEAYQISKINSNNLETNYGNINYKYIDNIWYLNDAKVYTIKSDAEAVIKIVEDQKELNIQNFKTNFVDKNVTVWTVQENSKLKSWEFNTTKEDDINITMIKTIGSFIDFNQTDNNRTETYHTFKK